MEDIIHLDLEFYSDEKRCEEMGRYEKRWEEMRWEEMRRDEKRREEMRWY